MAVDPQVARLEKLDDDQFLAIVGVSKKRFWNLFDRLQVKEAASRRRLTLNLRDRLLCYFLYTNKRASDSELSEFFGPRRKTIKKYRSGIADQIGDMRRELTGSRVIKSVPALWILGVLAVVSFVIAVVDLGPLSSYRLLKENHEQEETITQYEETIAQYGDLKEELEGYRLAAKLEKLNGAEQAIDEVLQLLNDLDSAFSDVLATGSELYDLTQAGLEELRHVDDESPSIVSIVSLSRAVVRDQRELTIIDRMINAIDRSQQAARELLENPVVLSLAPEDLVAITSALTKTLNLGDEAKLRLLELKKGLRSLTNETLTLLEQVEVGMLLLATVRSIAESQEAVIESREAAAEEPIDISSPDLQDRLANLFKNIYIAETLIHYWPTIEKYVTQMNEFGKVDETLGTDDLGSLLASLQGIQDFVDNLSLVPLAAETELLAKLTQEAADHESSRVARLLSP